MRLIQKAVSILIEGLVLCTVVSAAGAAEQAEYTVPVTVTREAATFSVTLPTSLPVNVSSDSVVTVATDAAIINHSGAPVCISKMELHSEIPNGIVPYSEGDINTGSPITFACAFDIVHSDGTKVLSGKTQGTRVTSETLYTQSSQPTRNEIIKRGESVSVKYMAIPPIFTENIYSEHVASVLFTITWAPQQTSFNTTNQGV